MDHHSPRSDVLLWVLAGVSILATSTLISHTLYREPCSPAQRPATPASPHYSPPLQPSRPRKRTSQTLPTETPEDRIPHDVLATLIAHPSWEIRRTASEIAVWRFQNSRPARRWLQGLLHSRSAESRAQALEVLARQVLSPWRAADRYDTTDYTSEGPRGEEEVPPIEEVERRAERRAREAERRSAEYFARQSLVGERQGGTPLRGSSLAGALRAGGAAGEGEGEWSEVVPNRNMDLGEFIAQMVNRPGGANVSAVVTTRDDGGEDAVELFVVERDGDQQGEEDEAERRRRNREAMALGTEEDGLEIVQIQRR